MLLVSKQYKSQVDLLRRQFVKRESTEYILKGAHPNPVPANGLELYMKMIWVHGGGNYNFPILNSGIDRKRSTSMRISTFLASLHELCATRYPRHWWRNTGPRKLHLNLPFWMTDKSSKILVYLCGVGNLKFLVTFNSSYLFGLLCWLDYN